MFSKVGVHIKDKSKVQAQHPCAVSHFKDGSAERGHEPAFDYQDLTSLSSRSVPGLFHRFIPASLNSLGCQGRKLIFSCRTFWPEASLNGAAFGLAFFYLLCDEQPANSADWHWAGTLRFLSLTLFSFCSTQLHLFSVSTIAYCHHKSSSYVFKLFQTPQAHSITWQIWL